MGKDKKARALGHMTLAAIGVVMASAIDSMRAAGVGNDVIHAYLDTLDDGFCEVLHGEAFSLMIGLVDVLRHNVAAND